MPKYLWQVSYTADGVRGIMKDGGSQRRRVVQDLIVKAGGRLEGFYYAFGESDVIVIADLPDPATAVAASFAVNATSAARLKTTVLLTPEELDAAAKKSVDYRPPGA